jgi:hypothetical protein
LSATGHSQFSASSAYRLLACPGAFALGQACDTGGRRSTVFSAEGTLAHSLSEVALFAGSDFTDVLGRTYSADGFQFTPDEAFVEGVQTYVDFIRGLEALGFIIVLETRVSPMIHWGGLADLGLDLFGTADCIAYHPVHNKLVIVDLKFGKGIAVEVKDNAQFLYYGAGAISLPLINYMREQHGHPPTNVLPTELETVVVQPRTFHQDGPIRRATYTTQQVVDWTRGTLYQGVERAINDNGKTLSAGDHCRFCPALAHCPAHEALVAEAAKDTFANAPIDNTPVVSTTGTDVMAMPTLEQQMAALPDAHLSDAKLGELLDKIAILKPYFAALEALAEERLKAAATRPGLNWKLVPTRTRRVWSDDEPTVVSALHNMGVAPGLYTETRLISPAQAERRMGKKQFRQLLDQLPLVKQSSPGTTLVPASDPRAQINEGRSAAEAFGINPPE